MNAKHIGVRIAKARKDRGLTLKSLGEAVNVHHSQLSRIERGQARLLGKNLQKICTFLGIEPLTRVADGQPQNFVARAEALLEEWPECEQVLNALLEALETSLVRDQRAK
ncbi:helix-turn-helix domain-containing protein [Pseudomonas sp. B21-009]|uniref:helix-turn-helix domain-containing protein n=1 Tax=Pseudomonas sp. B21-009 TaxID=2895470 RepID=UPI0038D418D5